MWLPAGGRGICLCSSSFVGRTLSWPPEPGKTLSEAHHGRKDLRIQRRSDPRQCCALRTQSGHRPKAFSSQVHPAGGTEVKVLPRALSFSPSHFLSTMALEGQEAPCPLSCPCPPALPGCSECLPDSQACGPPSTQQDAADRKEVPWVMTSAQGLRESWARPGLHAFCLWSGLLSTPD